MTLPYWASAAVSIVVVFAVWVAILISIATDAGYQANPFGKQRSPSTRAATSPSSAYEQPPPAIDTDADYSEHERRIPKQRFTAEERAANAAAAKARAAAKAGQFVLPLPPGATLWYDQHYSEYSEVSGQKLYRVNRPVSQVWRTYDEGPLSAMCSKQGLRWAGSSGVLGQAVQSKADKPFYDYSATVIVVGQRGCFITIGLRELDRSGPATTEIIVNYYLAKGARLTMQ